MLRMISWLILHDPGEYVFRSWVISPYILIVNAPNGCSEWRSDFDRGWFPSWHGNPDEYARKSTVHHLHKRENIIIQDSVRYGVYFGVTLANARGPKRRSDLGHLWLLERGLMRRLHREDCTEKSFFMSLMFFDICFISWQQILNRFWYLLTFSNMTDWRLYMMIDCLRLMSQGFHVVAWTDCYPDAEELLNSGMPTYFVDADDAGWRRPKDHTCVWYCIICQQSTNFVLLLKDRLQLRFWPFAVELLLWELLLRWLKIKIQAGRAWGSYWWSMWCILCWQLGFVPSTSRPEKPFEEQALLWRLLHSKRMNCCWYFELPKKMARPTSLIFWPQL